MKKTNPLDIPETTIQHSKIIWDKKILRLIYLDYYQQIKHHLKDVPKGQIIELGSGGGFIKKVIKNTTTSDVIPLPSSNLTFDATKIPLKNQTVSAFVMLNVLHHIKDPKKALEEMQRCLKPKGKIIMIEPYNSIWGRFIWQNFHHENFDPTSNWKVKGSGPLSDANGALPWIIFKRDYSLYNRTFPNLKLKFLNPHSPLSYLLSGGLSKPQLIPTSFYPILKGLENLLSPLRYILGMFVTITLQKSN